MTDNTPSPSNSEDEIDLRDIIITLWKARKQILTTAIIFAIIGGIIGFLTPATYTASSTFLPQTAQTGGGLPGNLGGLASLAGVNLNAPMAGGDIPPSMYSIVLTSEPFRKRILDSKIYVNGDSLTYRSYLENQPSSALGTIQDYTIGLPGKVIGLLSTKEEKKETTNEFQGLKPLSNLEYGLQNSIANKISIENEAEGIITISVVENNPIIAAQLTQVTEIVLKEWIREHKIKNAKAQYDFVVKQFEAKQKEFFTIQEQLAGYIDRNQNVLSASYLTRLQRLQAEFDLLNSVYSELAKQKEQAAIQLSKDTPTFSVLDPVKVPMEKNGPNKILYVLGAFFVGFIFSIGWFLFKKPVVKLFRGLYVRDL
jgi:capsular polysaccharide biosynthesis protein